MDAAMQENDQRQDYSCVLDRALELLTIAVSSIRRHNFDNGLNQYSLRVKHGNKNRRHKRRTTTIRLSISLQLDYLTFTSGTNVLVLNSGNFVGIRYNHYPGTVVDGMTISFSTTQAITTLIVNGNTGQILLVDKYIGSWSFTFVYRLSNNTWYTQTNTSRIEPITGPTSCIHILCRNYFFNGTGSHTTASTRRFNQDKRLLRRCGYCASSGTTLTVSAVSSGAFGVGQTVTFPGSGTYYGFRNNFND
jgi:hypothetical protein